ncbi:MAG: DUF3137 domain-containing protein [Ginsengibacter sp.]
MEDIKDFESFYESRLRPFLAELDAQSNDASKWATAGIASVILVVVCFVIDQSLAGFLFIILLFVSVRKYVGTKDDLTHTFKETIIREIIKYLNPGAEYNPSKKISSQDYKKSGLFNHVFNNYHGEDFINGFYKGVNFYCSELVTSYNSKGESGDSQSIFSGLFFAAPINSAFTRATYVWPCDDDQFPKSIADEYFHRFMSLPKVYRVKADNPEFEKHFVVYSTFPSEARQIIDTEMMSRMFRFKNQIKRDTRFSFVDGVCYVAIAVDEDLLEPSVSNPGNKENIKEYFFSILLILSIINQLNLSRLL